MAEIYKRGSVWWLSYWNGKDRVRKSLKTRSKHVANREKQAKEAELSMPHRVAVAEKNPAVGAFWAKYLDWAKDHKRPRSIDISETAWRYLMELTKPKKVGDIQPADIELFKKSRLDKGNTPTTVNNFLRDIQAIINRGIKMGLYTGSNPVALVERYKVERREPEFHTEDELNRLLDAATAHSQALEWTVLLGGWAGLRKMEIVNTRWEWLVFDDAKPLIHVQSFEGFTIKNHQDRLVPMSRRIFDGFYPHRRSEGFVFESDRKSEGRCRYRFDPKKSLDVVLADAGLTTDEPFQRLRRSFGSIHVIKGKSIYSVSKWLGHSSVTVTERHYAGLQAYDPDIDSF